MKDNLETFPKDGKWMSAYRWKERFKKELRERTIAGEGYIEIKEILGK